MRTRAITVSLLLAAGLTLSACGEDADSAAEPGPTPTSASSTPSETPSEEPEPEEPEPEGTIVVVTIEGDRIEPNGASIEADLDEPVVLAITSDRAGELHVHSTPEQYVDYEQGSHEYELTFEQPGVVEVEDHETGFVIAQLQVS